MSNNVVIRIEGLGKRYKLGQTVDLKRTFRETLMDLPRFFGHKAARTLKNAAKRTLSAARVQELQAAVRDHRTADPETPPGTFWALRDINLEVEHGEVVGIIGRNGAGKSTLLKILSRVTDPTTGHAEIHGRIASLLEVGTGFNPELTGRENIYLNGSIMGMKKAEIDRKFDEIVAFAEVERFLDTPVKRYSSGMSVRLAFAVAAHLEPEILIVDEVLAVGDMAFQKKCLGKMNNVAREGRTILFVSHNMAAVSRMCTRGLLLSDGRNIAQGNTLDVIEQYEKSVLKSQFRTGDTPGVVISNLNTDESKFDIRTVQLCDYEGRPITALRTFDDVSFNVKLHAPKALPRSSVSILITNLNEEIVLRLAMRPHSNFTIDLKPGLNETRCRIRRIPLPAGVYQLKAAICAESLTWLCDEVIGELEVGMKDVFDSCYPPIEKYAIAVANYSWETP